MHKLNVLIVEDDASTALCLEEFVRQAGHEVCGIADSGEKARAAAQELRPDLVFMDMHLKDGVTGVISTRNIVRELRIPVIIISSTDDEAELKEIQKSRAFGFIQKPVSYDEVRVNLDICARHIPAFRALIKNQTLNKNIFDNAAVGIYICHLDGYYIACNNAFAHMLGYATPQELLRTVVSVDEQVYGGEGPRASFLTAIRAGQSLCNQEAQIYGKDCDRIWVSEHLVPYHDADNVLQGYEGVVININGQKRAEAEKDLALTLMNCTMDAVKDWIVVTDFAGNIIFSNKSFQSGAPDAALAGVLRLETAREQPVAFPMAFMRSETMVLDTEGRDLFAILEEKLEATSPEYYIGLRCRLAEYPNYLYAQITAYTSPDGGKIGAVFVLHQYQCDR
ncbi:MAG: response regulator [Desulfovibrio sp.]|jgi:PAS domain S-box-containing protein|nr:response regulator [Desulfovibrio sp.]